MTMKNLHWNFPEKFSSFEIKWDFNLQLYCTMYKIYNKFYFSWDSLFENNINFNCTSLVDVKMTRVPSALSTNRPVSSFTNVSMGSKNMECA